MEEILGTLPMYILGFECLIEWVVGRGKEGDKKWVPFTKDHKDKRMVKYALDGFVIYNIDARRFYTKKL